MGSPQVVGAGLAYNAWDRGDTWYQVRSWRIEMVGRLSILSILIAVTLIGGCGPIGSMPTSECRSADLEVVVLAGAEGVGFGAIGAIAVGTDGTAYLHDQGGSSLVAFSPDGDEVWRLSDTGAGLPDFSAPGRLHRQGDLLVYEDRSLGELSLWTEAGAAAGGVELEAYGLTGPVVWVGVLGGGRVAAVVEVADDHDELSSHSSLALVIAGQGLVDPDTLAVVDLPPVQEIEVGGYLIPVDAPYAAEPSFVVSAEGQIAVAAGSEYLVQVYSSAGARYGEIRDTGALPRVTASDRRAFGRLLPDTLLVDQLSFPERHPAIRALAPTADGHLLVRTSWTQRDGVRWDRWSLEGEYVDSFLLPASMQLVTGVGNLIYGRAVDVDGADRLEIYNLSGPSTCPGPAISPAGARSSPGT